MIPNLGRENVVGISPSRRELEILELVALGLTNAEIGSILYVGQETVKSHVRHLLWKLDARNRTYLVTRGYEEGWLTIQSIKDTRGRFLTSVRNRGLR
jgi:DNA-binding NarL/FixJ family response regulator